MDTTSLSIVAKIVLYAIDLEEETGIAPSFIWELNINEYSKGAKELVGRGFITPEGYTIPLAGVQCPG